MTQVKICGLRRAADVDLAVEAGADFLGFIFYPPSPRNLDLKTAAELTDRASGHAKRVAVLVDPDNEFLKALTAAVPLDLVQLHGHETPDRVREIRETFRVGVSKAIRVATVLDLKDVERYAAASDRLLFDAKAPPGELPGGTGLSFDWQVLRGLGELPVPWGLAGGLTPENVATAVDLLAPNYVDVASGVETAESFKDAAKVRAFIGAATGTAAICATGR